MTYDLEWIFVLVVLPASTLNCVLLLTGAHVHVQRFLVV